jgi:hypothetical protein
VAKVFIGQNTQGTDPDSMIIDVRDGGEAVHVFFGQKYFEDIISASESTIKEGGDGIVLIALKEQKDDLGGQINKAVFDILELIKAEDFKDVALKVSPSVLGKTKIRIFFDAVLLVLSLEASKELERTLIGVGHDMTDNSLSSMTSSLLASPFKANYLANDSYEEIDEGDGSPRMTALLTILEAYSRMES